MDVIQILAPTQEFISIQLSAMTCEPQKPLQGPVSIEPETSKILSGRRVSNSFQFFVRLNVRRKECTAHDQAKSNKQNHQQDVSETDFLAWDSIIWPNIFF